MQEPTDVPQAIESPQVGDTRVDILLVDDREDGLVALEALLHNQANYNLVKARSGYEAIRKLAEFDFALILLDVQMPGLDGFQTAELIRRQVQQRTTPILFVTAINKDDRYVGRGYEMGAVDYIFKPFDPIILRSKVAVFAELHLKNRKIRQLANQVAEREALEHRAHVQSLELESLRRYRNLANAIPHIIFRALGPDSLVYHNELWTEYTGMEASESLGSNWQKAVDPRDLTELLLAWRKALSTGKPFESESRLCRSDRAFRWYWIKFVPDYDANQKPMAWIATCTEIHNRKMAEQSLRETQKKAEAANDAKTHFLANMSHEIRTPLNAIMGFTELLLDPDVLPEEKLKSASIVSRNGHQLLKIVDEILDISKIEAGGLEIEKVETSILELLDEIKALMLIQASNKNINLFFEITPGMPQKVMTDATRLRQILLNIIGNAIKFTDEGCVQVKARFLNRNNSHVLLFEVNDTGLGIDPGSVNKVFEPFSQADSSTTRLYGGTGLGLALSRRLAQALGGNVRLAHSHPGRGSQFEIEILVTPVLNERNVEQVKAIESGGEMRALEAPELHGKRILLVEDAEDNQLLIAHILGRTGAQLDVASNGQEGVKKALANPYAVVLMDIQMPLMDGYQATARLRQAGYKQPIIALTAHAMAEEREKTLSTGCNAHITKPINRQQLIESLVKLVQQV